MTGSVQEAFSLGHLSCGTRSSSVFKPYGIYILHQICSLKAVLGLKKELSSHTHTHTQQLLVRHGEMLYKPTMAFIGGEHNTIST